MIEIYQFTAWHGFYIIFRAFFWNNFVAPVILFQGIQINETYGIYEWLFGSNKIFYIYIVIMYSI